MIPAQIIDLAQLGEIVLASALASIGIAAVFGLAIVCATRTTEARSAGRSGAAAAYAAGTALCVLAFFGAVGVGLAVMISG